MNIDFTGMTFAKISGAEQGSDVILFECNDGKQFKMDHDQDCCESVSVEDVVGDVNDLIGFPIVSYEESSNSDNPPPNNSYNESYTWTFYKFQSTRGHVTIRWFGSSNGYYSEHVNVCEVTS
jgi:hypothetical protein